MENVKTRLHDVRVEVREIEAADCGVQDAKKIERQVSTSKQQNCSLHADSSWLLAAGTTTK